MRTALRTTFWLLLLSLGYIVLVRVAGADDRNIDRIRAHLQQGERELTAGHYRSAIASFQIGLEQLGPSYSPQETLDDTGQKLALAQANERAGRLKESAVLYRNVLSSRLVQIESRRQRNVH